MQEYCYNCMSPMEGDYCHTCGCRRNSVSVQAYQLQPGTVLQGRYLLGRSLGHGAFGITYIGIDLRLRRKVAVKEYYPSAYANRISAVSPEVTLTNAEEFFVRDGKQKFLREAQTLAEFWDVPGIVSVLDFFEENGTAYIVMQYLEGQTLKEILKYSTFSADDIISLMMPVMSALAIVHQNGIIHRDIAPDNLMLQPDGSLVLMDFGAAREYAMATQQSMTIMIKRGYAPEEQYRARGNVGPWTDVYALCATMYYCITGLIPEESIERAVKDELILPSLINIPITKSQERTLLKGMSIDSANRFQSMEELQAAFLSIRPAALKPKVEKKKPEAPIVTPKPAAHAPAPAPGTPEPEKPWNKAEKPESPSPSAKKPDRPVVKKQAASKPEPQNRKEAPAAEQQIQKPSASRTPWYRQKAFIISAASAASLLVIIIIMITAFSISSISPAASLTVSPSASPATSGTCGDDLTWSLSESGTLTIAGSGTMEDFRGSGSPWFDYYQEIQTVKLEDSVTSIGDYAFSGCTGLTAVYVPDSVTSIGDYAFSGCTGLTAVSVPDSVTSIGNCAFYGCTGLTGISIPYSVMSIEYGAFWGCTGLTAVSVPDSVTSIGNSAFRGCTGLTAVSIPDSVTSIGNSAFYGCTGLTDISIPDSVTSIGSSAFSRCTGLTAVSIPSSVWTIGNSAFYGCTGLTDISIPDSVTSIGSFAFAGCTGLTDVYYSGTEDQLADIDIEDYNSALFSATIHYNS